jgi:myo-inositol 2-dehydrogenase/D-chiro-inositol 1-dehydrogenase
MLATARLGFIGSGGMASAHLKAMGPMPDVEIAAFCDVDESKSAARVAELKAIRPDANPRAYSDPDVMLRDMELDAVYILLPPFAHGPAERACLVHKKPFFVEKPISKDLGFSREIAAETEKTGLLTCAGYMNRYRAGVQKGRELLLSDPAALAHGGWIGGSPNPKPGDTSIGSWWVQMDKSGGQIVEQCTHTFDVVRYVCGEAVEVFAHAARGFNKGLYNYTIDDASSVNIQLANGGVVNLMSSCCANGGGGGVWLNVYAHDTTLLFTGWEHSVKILRKGAEPEEIKGEGDIFAVEDAVFLQAIRSGDGGKIQSSYSDATKTLELTLAANESIMTGKPVPVGR